VLRSAFTPTLLKQVKKRLTGKSRLENTLEHSLISRRFGDEVSLEERLLEYDRETHTQGQVSLRQACIDRVTAPYLAAANERGWRTAIYCGVEHRKPFLDKRVVEFCVSLPWDQKFRHGWSKLIVRRLAETILPSEIAWRKGWEHLGWSFTEAWLKRERKAILEVLDRNRENLEQFVDPGKYSRVIDDFRVAEDKVDENVRVLHGLACWLERHGW
jgi:asparagine synthase (glutamine-hydrolysing)